VIITAAADQLTMTVQSTGVSYELVAFSATEFLGNTFPYAAVLFTFRDLGDGRLALLVGDAARGNQFAVRLPASEAALVTVNDPQGRYTLQVPTSYVQQALGDLLVFIQAQPRVIVTTLAIDAESADPLAELERISRLFDPNFALKPGSTQEVTIGERTWTEYVYQLPSDQVNVNYVFIEGEVTYVYSYLVAAGDLEATKPSLDAQLASFTLTNP
jgi:hypothetical protein